MWSKSELKIIQLHKHVYENTKIINTGTLFQQSVIEPKTEVQLGHENVSMPVSACTEFQYQYQKTLNIW